MGLEKGTPGTDAASGLAKGIPGIEAPGGGKGEADIMEP